MTKGTKQIRLGRVARFIEKMEIRVRTLEELLAARPHLHVVAGQIAEAKNMIAALKKEFEL
jgi:hypothetical protein